MHCVWICINFHSYHFASADETHPLSHPLICQIFFEIRFCKGCGKWSNYRKDETSKSERKQERGKKVCKIVIYNVLHYKYIIGASLY